MTFTYRLKSDEYIEYSRYLMTSTPNYKTKILIQRSVAALLILVLGAAYVLITDSSIPKTAAASAVAAVIIFAFYPKFASAGQKQAVLNYIKADKNEELFNEQTLAIDEKGMEITSGENKLYFEKEDLLGMSESGSLFYINIKNGNLMLFPKRCLNDEEDREKFIYYSGGIFKENKK